MFTHRRSLSRINCHNSFLKTLLFSLWYFTSCSVATSNNLFCNVSFGYHDPASSSARFRSTRFLEQSLPTTSIVTPQRPRSSGEVLASWRTGRDTSFELSTGKAKWSLKIISVLRLLCRAANQPRQPSPFKKNCLSSARIVSSSN